MLKDVEVKLLKDFNKFLTEDIFFSLKFNEQLHFTMICLTHASYQFMFFDDVNCNHKNKNDFLMWSLKLQINFLKVTLQRLFLKAFFVALRQLKKHLSLDEFLSIFQEVSI